MASLTEDEIRTRAYLLWKAAGEPEGNIDTFWYQAEKELIEESRTTGELPPGMTDNLPV
jgi:hypothetical protein